MGGKRSKAEGKQICIKLCWKNLKARDNMEGTSVNENIILKGMLHK
jgi:hypothetical protein